VIAELADAQGNAPALIAVSGKSLSCHALIERANGYAHWALDHNWLKTKPSA
jgi:hypothetical protein